MRQARFAGRSPFLEEPRCIRSSAARYRAVLALATYASRLVQILRRGIQAPYSSFQPGDAVRVAGFHRPEDGAPRRLSVPDGICPGW